MKNFARFVCSFRENPLLVYSHDLNGQKVVSSRIVFSNTILSFYTPCIKAGRYVSYNAKSGKEDYDVVNSTKAISKYAPIVQLGKLPSPFDKETTKIKNKFKPIEIENLGSLARLTYDPEMPDEPDLTLFTFPFGTKWIIGYTTTVELEDVIYCFNYVTLEKEPTKPFLKYSGHDGKEPEFTDKFQHGYPYLPVIKLKDNHALFGLKN